MKKTSGKKGYDLSRMFELIRKAIQPFPRAMLFEIRDQGFSSPFELLVACILSIRTRDEISLIVVKELFTRARTPNQFLQMSLDSLADKIRLCTFPHQKAKSILHISQITLDQYGGQLPCDFESLTALPGVGPKCANLVLGISCGTPAIGVDIHVHRVTNRWGLVRTSGPNQTLKALEERLPRSKWIEINGLLVPFGKHICTGSRPHCPTCPVLNYCHQVGVEPKLTRRPGKFKPEHQVLGSSFRSNPKDR